jgi:metal-responsive CopG/Arc/MetJ family transcriptional regulator
MYSLRQLEKQQIGLRLPKYLVDDLDELTQSFSLNRSEIILEAVKSYIDDQKTQLFYQKFEDSTKELKTSIVNEHNNLQTLDELINELENN